jgi:hypothetical protein
LNEKNISIVGNAGVSSFKKGARLGVVRIGGCPVKCFVQLEEATKAFLKDFLLSIKSISVNWLPDIRHDFKIANNLN